MQKTLMIRKTGKIFLRVLVTVKVFVETEEVQMIEKKVERCFINMEEDDAEMRGLGRETKQLGEISYVLKRGIKLLPADMEFDKSRGLLYNNRLIANSLLFVDAVREEIQIPSQEKAVFVEVIAIVAPDMEMYSQDIPFDALKSYDFQQELCPRIYIEYGCKDTKVTLYNLLCQQIANVTPTKRYVLTQLGWFCIDGIRGYNAGDSIIGNMGEMDVKSSEQLCKYKLQLPEPISKSGCQVLTSYINQYLHLYEGKTPLVFAYLILGVLRSHFEEAGVAIKFCMFLLGKNQSYKTTIASYGCSIYNRLDDVETHIHNLTGTEAFLMQVLDQEKDMVAIIDDLNKSDSMSVERRQEEKISNLVRAAANNVGRKTMKNNYDINAQVLFCGEYALKNMSTNNRMVVLEFEQDGISKEALTRFEQEAGYLGMFVKEFILWCIDNHDRIIQKIRDEFLAFRTTTSAEASYQERLTTNYKLLDIAFSIAHEYFADNFYRIDIDYRKFATMLENAMLNQIELLELDGKKEEDYVMQVFTVVEDNWNEYVFSKKPSVNCWRKKICYDKKHDCICIPGEALLTELVEQYSGRSVAAHKIINQFESLGLLVKDNNKQRSRTKKVYGKRAYWIKYTEWRNYVQETYTE